MNRESVLLPTSYFPPISYFGVLWNYDCKIELYENYQKRSIRNKSIILGANGKLQLSVPLKKGKTQKPIKEVEIDYSEDWVLNHIRSIRSAYGTSAYFDFYFQKVCDLLNQRPSKLYLLNHSILTWIEEQGFMSNIIYTDEFIHPDKCSITDFRYTPIISSTPEYEQVFTEKYGFVDDLSILDLIFNLGPESLNIIKKVNINLQLN